MKAAPAIIMTIALLTLLFILITLIKPSDKIVKTTAEKLPIYDCVTGQLLNQQAVSDSAVTSSSSESIEESAVTSSSSVQSSEEHTITSSSSVQVIVESTVTSSSSIQTAVKPISSSSQVISKPTSTVSSSSSVSVESEIAMPVQVESIEASSAQ